MTDSHDDMTAETKDIDNVYHERNLLALAFLAAYAERAHFAASRDAIENHFTESSYDEDHTAEMGWWPDENEEGWAVIWVNLYPQDPNSQVGWHIPMEMVPFWLHKRDPRYDGYTTEEKNQRLESFIVSSRLSCRDD